MWQSRMQLLFHTHSLGLEGLRFLDSIYHDFMAFRYNFSAFEIVCGFISFSLSAKVSASGNVREGSKSSFKLMVERKRLLK